MRIIRTLITGIDSHSQDPDDAFADLGLSSGLLSLISIYPHCNHLVEARKLISCLHNLSRNSFTSF